MSAPLLVLENITKRYELERRVLPRLLGRRRPLLAVNNVERERSCCKYETRS